MSNISEQTSKDDSQEIQSLQEKLILAQQNQDERTESQLLINLGSIFSKHSSPSFSPLRALNWLRDLNRD